MVKCLFCRWLEDFDRIERKNFCAAFPEKVVKGKDAVFTSRRRFETDKERKCGEYTGGL
jgi:hypothetical protein